MHSPLLEQKLRSLRGRRSQIPRDGTRRVLICQTLEARVILGRVEGSLTVCLRGDMVFA